MARVAKEIDVRVPVHMAYDQWTQFETFPEFMDGVKCVEQIDDRHLNWEASIFGRDKKWEAEIREQIPDQLIVWNSVDGSENAGAVQFESLKPDVTRVRLELSYDTEGISEAIGDAFGVVSRRVEGDLGRFRDFIESRVEATGAYHGELSNPDVPGGHTRGEL